MASNSVNKILQTWAYRACDQPLLGALHVNIIWIVGIQIPLYFVSTQAAIKNFFFLYCLHGDSIAGPLAPIADQYAHKTTAPQSN